MEQTTTEIPKKNSKEEIGEKLKKAIQTFFSQLKIGCFRKNCYNPNCLKSELKNAQNDKIILAEALKLARESNYELGICMDSKNFIISENSQVLENFLFTLDKEEKFNYNAYFDLDRLPPLNLNFDKLSSECDKIDFIEFTILINSFLDFCIEKYPKSDFEIKDSINIKSFIRWNFYVYYISLKFLIIISLHQNFNYSEITRDCLTLFFQKILKIKSKFKKFLSFYKNGYLVPLLNKNLSFTDKEYEIIKLQKKNSFDVSNMYNLNNNLNNYLNIENNTNSNSTNNNTHNNENNRMEIVQDSHNSKPNSDNMEIENVANSPKIGLNEELKNENNSLASINIRIKKENGSENDVNDSKIILENKNELKEIYIKKLNNLNYNIEENSCYKLFVQNSNYYEIEQLANGLFDPYAVFLNHFHYMPFIDFITNKDKFLNIIHNYQNFLLLVIMINVDEDEGGFKLTDIVLNFMPIFEIFYKVNEILQLVDNTEFYNDYINRNVEVNFQLECKNYLKYLKNEDKSKFCWLRYFWIFDARSKSEILCEFNNKTQREEFVNQMQNITNMLNFTSNSLNPYLIMQIKRNNMIEDSLNLLVNPQINFKKQLKVKFIGEQGIDEGGVKKEYFLLLVRQIFNAEYGMFTYSDKTRFFWFNQFSFEAKIKFELIGIIFGLAFYNNVILDVKFPLVIYKKLLNIKPTLNDLQEIDEELYKNFMFLLNTKEKNLKELLGTTFTATLDSFGEKQIISLKADGENIFIDEQNRFEYVELYLDWFFNKSIEEFFLPFKKGFYRVCDDKLFHILKPSELELIVCGSQILDFVELEKSARYQDGFDENSETIKHFWEVVHTLSHEEKKKFLSFLTGCDRAPIDGLGSLIITISRFGPDSDKLPCAHTCFNHLLIPDYQNLEKMRNRLMIAINHYEGFGLM